MNTPSKEQAGGEIMVGGSTGPVGIRCLVREMAPFFAIITAVWLLRLVAGMVEDVPRWVLRSLSVSAVVPFCVVIAACVIHFRRLGGFPAVVVTAFLLVAWSELLVSAAIFVTWFSGWENIYSIPRFTPPGRGGYLGHILGHLTFGIGFGALFGSLMGGFVLILLRWISPSSKE